MIPTNRVRNGRGEDLTARIRTPCHCGNDTLYQLGFNPYSYTHIKTSKYLFLLKKKQSFIVNNSYYWQYLKLIEKQNVPAKYISYIRMSQGGSLEICKSCADEAGIYE